MIVYSAKDYNLVTAGHSEIKFIDHMNGFSESNTNALLDKIKDVPSTVYTQVILSKEVRNNYPNLNFKFFGHFPALDQLRTLTNLNHDKKFENFVCSFNGADAVNRQFLTAALHKRSWFNFDYCSKNFSYSTDRLDGNIALYCTDKQERVYRKFILEHSESADNFYNTDHGFDYTAADHQRNLLTLVDKINKSFVQVVGETVGVSYHPWFSEKFLYPVVAKNLWVAYAQPGYYSYLTHYYKFKKYDKLFDYEFDTLKNPVERLIELLSMLSKFSYLTPMEWHDLYLIEQDTIEYNYDHYMSGDYLKCINKYLE